MALDPDDPRPPYQQVSSALRASILTGKLAPGDQLPSGSQLASRYGVARMTVQQAIRVLRDEGLVVSRQGSGVFVRERTARPVELRPVLERAFVATDVSIDFSGFSGETLNGALTEPLDKIRAGQFVPNSIAIRILATDSSEPMPLPCRADTLEDDPDFRARSTVITQRSTQAIADSVHELADLGLITSGTVEIRLHPTTPLFKLYILNGQEAFFGFYPVVSHEIRIGEDYRSMYLLMGKDTVLFHHARAERDDTSTDSLYLDQAQAWFDSVWNTIAYAPSA
jgi:DNA-binding transcriptional regulator YhcF (GntR family)